jgi:uncharacterized membrane protein
VKRIAIALLYLLIGVAFAFTPAVVAPNGCKEACPEWFSLSAFAFMLSTPVTWLCVGLWVGRSTVKRSTLGRMSAAILLVTLIFVCAVAFLGNYYQQTSSYGAISG